MKNSWKKLAALFLGSQAVSLFGSSIVQYAVVWFVARETSSGIMMTLITITSFLPQVLVSLFAGVWADRYSRKKLIIAADATIAVSTLILAFIMMSGVENYMTPLLIISAIRSAGSGIQAPAVSALLPQLVPEEELMRVNGYNGSIQSVVGLAAPAAAGVILALGPISNILFIDVVTAVIGISIFLFFVPVPLHDKAKSKQDKSFFDDLKIGLKYLYNHKFVKDFLILYALYCVLIVPLAMLNVLFVTRIFGDAYYFLTMNEISFSIGMIAGGVILGAWGGFKNRITTLGIGIGGSGVCAILMALFTGNFNIYMLLMGIVGLFIGFANAASMTLVQEKVENNMQGRVFSLVTFIGGGLMPLTMAVAGPLADVVSIGSMYIVTGIFLIIYPAFMYICMRDFYNKGVKETVKEIS